MLLLSFGFFGCTQNPQPEQQLGLSQSERLQSEPTQTGQTAESERLQTESLSQKIPVIVAIEPQAFFLSQIGGDRVHVEVLVPTGKEPETYVPNPEKIKQFAKSRLFFRIGFPSEQTLLPKLQTVAPNLRIVDTRKGLPLRKMLGHTHFDPQVSHLETASHSETAFDVETKEVGHNHVEEDCSEQTICEQAGSEQAESERDQPVVVTGDDFVESGLDPHIWLSPTLVKQQATTICAALCEFDPTNRLEYEGNLDRFLVQLEETRIKVADILRDQRGATIYVFHPAYGYFCEEFELRQRAIEVEGKSPKPKELADWIRRAKEDKVKRILIQPEFNPAPAEQIAKQVDAKVIIHSSLGRDYFHDLIELAELIAQDHTSGN